MSRSKEEYATHWDRAKKDSKSIAEPPYEPLQAIGVVPLSTDDQLEFAYMAHHYKIEGETPANLCRWNAEVSRVVTREFVKGLWRDRGHLRQGR
jgi:hypothetical protein